MQRIFEMKFLVFPKNNTEILSPGPNTIMIFNSKSSNIS